MFHRTLVNDSAWSPSDLVEALCRGEGLTAQVCAMSQPGLVVDPPNMGVGVQPL